MRVTPSLGSRASLSTGSPMRIRSDKPNKPSAPGLLIHRVSHSLRMTQPSAKRVRTLPKSATLNCQKVVSLPGAPAPPEGLTHSLRHAVCRPHASPSSARSLQLSPKTFGVSIRTAFPRTRRGSVSPPPPHVPAQPGAPAPLQPPSHAAP